MGPLSWRGWQTRDPHTIKVVCRFKSVSNLPEENASAHISLCIGPHNTIQYVDLYLQYSAIFKNNKIWNLLVVYFRRWFWWVLWSVLWFKCWHWVYSIYDAGQLYAEEILPWYHHHCRGECLMNYMLILSWFCT